MLDEHKETVNQLRDTIERILEDYDGEYWREQDRVRAYPTAFVEKLTELGLLASLIPEEYGGSGLPLSVEDETKGPTACRTFDVSNDSPGSVKWKAVIHSVYMLAGSRPACLAPARTCCNTKSIKTGLTAPNRMTPSAISPAIRKLLGPHTYPNDGFQSGHPAPDKLL